MLHAMLPMKLFLATVIVAGAWQNRGGGFT